MLYVGIKSSNFHAEGPSARSGVFGSAKATDDWSKFVCPVSRSQNGLPCTSEIIKVGSNQEFDPVAPHWSPLKLLLAFLVEGSSINLVCH